MARNESTRHRPGIDTTPIGQLTLPPVAEDVAERLRQRAATIDNGRARPRIDGRGTGGDFATARNSPTVTGGVITVARYPSGSSFA